MTMKRRQFILGVTGAVSGASLLRPLYAQTPPAPSVYRVPPVITALVYSPDGSALAVSGYREVILHKANMTGIIARLVGKSDRIESIAYSPDGKTMGVVGGSPARFGEVQFWDTTTNTLLKAAEVAPDSLFGASFSPDGKSLGCGGADSAVRVISVPDGKVKLKFDNHSDWTFATTWATDNKQILSTGRDRAIKLVIAENGSFVDDINTHTSSFRAMAHHPKAEQVLVGGDDGIVRLYQVFRSTPRTMNQEDHNLLRSYDSLSFQINTLVFSKDGTLFAAGGEGSAVYVFRTDNGGEAKPDKPTIGGKPLLTLTGHKGTIHTLAFHPDGKTLATGGFDGLVRLYASPSGRLIGSYVPVPITKPASA